MIGRASAALALLALATAAGAQAPAYSPPNGGLLRPGEQRFTLLLVRATDTVALGERTVSVSESAPGGVPAWRVSESRVGTSVVTSDTVELTRADLRPLRWAAANGMSLLALSFTPDSAFGALQGPRGRSSLAIAVPVGTLLSQGMVEAVLALLPLRSDYRSSVSLLLAGPGPARLVPAELAVEREEEVATRDGVARAWRVALRWGAGEARYWVTADRPRVVRSEQAVRSGTLVGTEAAALR